MPKLFFGGNRRKPQIRDECMEYVYLPLGLEFINECR